ncbi:MAG TPA: YqgE/AlgH family protein [Candidatus Paceibacterota bacterium]|nr:YqgE/AlgH family protein [Candidatus Paceibacterota bacterium]
MGKSRNVLLKAGDLLIAEPLKHHGLFSRSAILVTEYDKEDGVIGIVINKLSDIYLEQIDETKSVLAKFPVYTGGLERRNIITILHRFDSSFIADSREIAPGIFGSNKIEEFEELILSNQTNDSNMRFFSGYHLWDSEKIEVEIENQKWFKVTTDEEIVDMIFARECDGKFWRKMLRYPEMSKFQVVNLFEEEPCLS